MGSGETSVIGIVPNMPNCNIDTNVQIEERDQTRFTLISLIVPCPPNYSSSAYYYFLKRHQTKSSRV